MPKLASQIRTAFSSIDPNTGVSSPGERADDLQHLGGRRLLLQRFREVVGALAQFVEQPRVLDGDDGLGGEILHQFDLLVGERPHLLPVDGECADRLTVLDQRRGQDGATPPTSTPVLVIGSPSR